jgi:hypothetical protein
MCYNRYSLGCSIQRRLQHLHIHVRMIGLLHGPAASVQQPPAERLPVPELAEGGNAKSGQFHFQWGSQGSWGHLGQGRWDTTSGDKGHMPNQIAFSVFFLWPTLLPTYMPCLSILATLSRFSPRLNLPPCPTGVKETLTLRSYSRVPGLTRTCLSVLAR